VLCPAVINLGAPAIVMAPAPMLSVSLLVSRMTQKPHDWFSQNSVERWRVVHRRI